MAVHGDLNKEKNVGDGHDSRSGKTRSVHSPKNDKVDEMIRKQISEEVAKAFEQTMPAFLTEIAFDEKENKTKGVAIIFMDGDNRDKVHPLLSQRWITEIESTFETCHCDPGDRIVFAVNQLNRRAKDWLHNLRKEKGSIGGISWEDFKEAFLKYHCPQAAVDSITEEFLRLRQTNESIDELAGVFL
ncbi:hypothetical protein L1987_32835 [Smallanthus sonchifolius]|uniref:Uncharacterized protein n=1 Tax=Smallanthus sonchifolius TaxID=185202 RepID=A0ACB9HRY4_9ASTR|nr:hypothetical protein L1987_32835 [Smallanthus sonchifolius]